MNAGAVGRLLCSSSLQGVLEDEKQNAYKLGRTTRVPSNAIMRQLRYRDSECQFPGCGAKRFTHAHHLVWWSKGGDTDLENLILVCGFHHRLVHDYLWRVTRDKDGIVTWFRPDGRRYEPGPKLAA